MKRNSYITFRLGQENFALPVTHVREVLDLEYITPLPLAPAHVRGVVKIRDEAVPVVDLRTRFLMPPSVGTLQTRIIVMEFSLEGKSFVVGGLADTVQEVIELTAEEISPPPSVGSQWKAGLIDGITLRDGAFIVLLNVETLFSCDELRTLVNTAPQAAGTEA